MKKAVQDPKRRERLKFFYYSPNSRTFGDLRNSARRVGYTETYIQRNLHRKKWFRKLERVGDRRQNKMRAAYLDPTSQTFGKFKASARAAGYYSGHAKNLHNMTWIKEMKDKYAKMVERAEKNFINALNYDDSGVVVGKDGEMIEIPFDHAKAKLKIDVSKFIAERLHKKRYGSTVDVTSDGKPIPILSAIIKEKE